jgi:hypothetical protein
MSRQDNGALARISPIELWCGIPSFVSLEGTRAAIYVELGTRAAHAFWGLDPFFFVLDVYRRR